MSRNIQITEEMLSQHPYYSCDYDTINDMMVDCLKREQILSEEEIDDEYCELYFEENFKAYKSKKDFMFDVSFERLVDEIKTTFKNPTKTPYHLIEKLVDDFFANDFCQHTFQDEIAENYRGIETDDGFYVIYTKDLTYWIDDIVDHIDSYLDDYDSFKKGLIDNLISAINN